MKYSLYLLSVLFLLPAALFAQVSFGPVIGINNTRYKYTANKKYNSPDRIDVVLDYRVGGIADILLDNNRLYLQPGLLFTHNSERTVDMHNHEKRLTFNINTVEIPLSVVLKGAKNGKKCWFGSAGLFFGINVNATQTINYYDNTGRYTGNDKLSIKINRDTVNAINPACFGIRADAGYLFDRSSSLKFFFQNAFTNFVKNPKPSDYSITRLNYGIAYTYQFPLKNKRRIVQLNPHR